ncbi:hypothetical protein BDZ91DRAFT_765239 [Kalaharituber pfeilii]|nr:hypothetical protein BDZ91DRAFT_765239 [Kalaharituber pfeilii]
MAALNQRVLELSILPDNAASRVSEEDHADDDYVFLQKPSSPASSPSVRSEASFVNVTDEFPRMSESTSFDESDLPSEDESHSACCASINGLVSANYGANSEIHQVQPVYSTPSANLLFTGAGQLVKGVALYAEQKRKQQKSTTDSKKAETAGKAQRQTTGLEPGLSAEAMEWVIPEELRNTWLQFLQKACNARTERSSEEAYELLLTVPQLEARQPSMVKTRGKQHDKIKANPLSRDGTLSKDLFNPDATFPTELHVHMVYTNINTMSTPLHELKDIPIRTKQDEELWTSIGHTLGEVMHEATRIYWRIRSYEREEMISYIQSLNPPAGLDEQFPWEQLLLSVVDVIELIIKVNGVRCLGRKWNDRFESPSRPPLWPESICTSVSRMAEVQDEIYQLPTKEEFRLMYNQAFRHGARIPEYFYLMNRMTFGCEIECIVAEKLPEVESRLQKTLKEFYATSFPEHSEHLERCGFKNDDYHEAVLNGCWRAGNFKNIYDFREQLGVKFVQTVLKESGVLNVTTRDNPDPDPEGHSRWVVDRDVTVKWIKWLNQERTESDYRHYATFIPKHLVAPTEIKTPKFWLFEDYLTWERELLALNNLFSKPPSPSEEEQASPPLKGYFNRTCSLHVHVGLGPDTTFPDSPQKWTFEQTKRIVMCYILFEPIIDTFHPRFRQTRDYATSVRHGRFGCSRFGRDLEERDVWGCKRSEVEFKSLREIRDEIWAAKDWDELSNISISWEVSKEGIIAGEIGRRERKLTFHNVAQSMRHINIQSTADRNVVGLGTLEWRQHAGTVDAVAITYWVWFVCWFCAVSVQAEDEVIDTLVYVEDKGLGNFEKWGVMTGAERKMIQDMKRSEEKARAKKELEDILSGLSDWRKETGQKPETGDEDAVPDYWTDHHSEQPEEVSGADVQDEGEPSYAPDDKSDTTGNSSGTNEATSRTGVTALSAQDSIPLHPLEPVLTVVTEKLENQIVVQEAIHPGHLHSNSVSTQAKEGNSNDEAGGKDDEDIEEEGQKEECFVEWNEEHEEDKGEEGWKGYSSQDNISLNSEDLKAGMRDMPELVTLQQQSSPYHGTEDVEMEGQHLMPGFEDTPMIAPGDSQYQVTDGATTSGQGIGAIYAIPQMPHQSYATTTRSGLTYYSPQELVTEETVDLLKSNEQALKEHSQPYRNEHAATTLPYYHPFPERTGNRNSYLPIFCTPPVTTSLEDEIDARFLWLHLMQRKRTLMDRKAMHVQEFYHNKSFMPMYIGEIETAVTQPPEEEEGGEVGSGIVTGVGSGGSGSGMDYGRSVEDSDDEGYQADLEPEASEEGGTGEIEMQGEEVALQVEMEH